MKLRIFEKEAGVYKIVNVQNGKTYIGQSVDLICRISGHIDALKKDKHPKKEMQNDFNQNGINIFDVVILEKYKKVSIRTLLDKEIEWAVKLHQSGIELYNLSDKRIYYACYPEQRKEIYIYPNYSAKVYYKKKRSYDKK